MNKIPCDVIKDLLPLYEDNVCGEKSKDIVEEHLTECEECREYYERMTEKLPAVTEETAVSMKAEDSFLTHVKRKLTYHKVLLSGILILAIFAISMLYENIQYSDTDFSGIPFFDKRLKTEEIHVTELYQLKNGFIYFTVETDRNATVSATSEILVPDTYIDKPYDNGWRNISLKRSFFDNFFHNSTNFSKCSYIIPLTEEEYIDPDISDSPVNQNCTTIYYKGKDNKQKKIWEKGQNIKPAPQNVELKVKEEIESVDFDNREGAVIFDVEFE